LAHLHSLCDLLIDPARSLWTLVGFEQDTSVGELASRSCARREQAFQLFSFSFAEDNGIFLLHNG
jgi:hypothetical protein